MLGLPVFRILEAIPQRLRKTLWVRWEERETGKESKWEEGAVIPAHSWIRTAPTHFFSSPHEHQWLGWYSMGWVCVCCNDGEVAFNSWPKYSRGRLLFPCPAAFLPQIPDAFFATIYFSFPLRGGQDVQRVHYQWPEWEGKHWSRPEHKWTHTQTHTHKCCH